MKGQYTEVVVEVRDELKALRKELHEIKEVLERPSYEEAVQLHRLQEAVR